MKTGKYCLHFKPLIQFEKYFILLFGKCHAAENVKNPIPTVLHIENICINILSLK